MEKICDYKTNTIQKIQTCTKEDKKNGTYYHIHLVRRNNRIDARLSLPIFKSGINPRKTASSSKSSEEAIIKLLDKIKIELIEGIKEKYIAADNLFNIFNNISISIKALDLQTDMLLSYLHNTVADIYRYLNMNMMESVNLQLTNCDICNNDNNFDASNRNTQIQNCQNIVETLPVNFPVTNCNVSGNNSNDLAVSNIKHQALNEQAVAEELSFKDVAIKWFNYKYSLTIKSIDNPKPLSKKTLQDYNRIMKLNLIPFFEKYRNIDDISNEELQRCIKETNGSRHKEVVYVVLKMIVDYAYNNKYVSDIRTIEKPPKAEHLSVLKVEGHDLVYIKSSRQSYWLDCFEKEGTDVAYLFEAMLLGGLRPEESCGLNWKSLQEDMNYFWVKDAYKDFPVYDENAEIIGHVREYDKLKTTESYRRVPIHPRYREILSKHKEKQKALFKKLKLKWTEETPIFLNRYHKAYVPENLSKALRTFRKKYGLEYLTPYGLRHSFATFLSEQGVRDVVLMKLMGHSDFSTTQKYYIFVSDERKKLEYEQAWGLIPTNTSNMNVEKSITIEQFEQFQNLWLQILNNQIVA